jgi:hypothetical protein
LGIFFGLIEVEKTIKSLNLLVELRQNSLINKIRGSGAGLTRAGLTRQSVGDINNPGKPAPP